MCVWNKQILLEIMWCCLLTTRCPYRRLDDITLEINYKEVLEMGEMVWNIKLGG